MGTPVNRSAFAASSVGMLIVAARRSIRQLVASLVAPLDLTPHQYWVLLILQSSRPLSLGELANHMWMDDPSVSRTVKVMADRGLIESGPDPSHGRRILIRLTPEGQALCGRLEQAAASYEVRMEAGLSDLEKASLHASLCKLLTNLDDILASDDSVPTLAAVEAP
jgi:DNA-binding MarR family transcriptional regulator